MNIFTDKLCDWVDDAIPAQQFKQNLNSRVGCGELIEMLRGVIIYASNYLKHAESVAKTEIVLVGGKIISNAVVD